MTSSAARRVALTTNALQRDGKACTHQVAFPDGTVVKAQPPPAVPKPALTFPFDIDPFQETAANALEAGDSVLVAAHTSAGKTVVAQYAIAMALRDKSRVRCRVSLASNAACASPTCHKRARR